jgi:hypothetical protein
MHRDEAMLSGDPVHQVRFSRFEPRVRRSIPCDQQATWQISAAPHAATYRSKDALKFRQVDDVDRLIGLRLSTDIRNWTLFDIENWTPWVEFG